MKQYTLATILCIALFSLGGNAFLIYKNYIDIAPNHPNNTQYRQLFPGINDRNFLGAFETIGAVQQYLAHNIIFVSAVHEDGMVDLVFISRAGCRSVEGWSATTNDLSTLTSYIGKPILITDFDYSFEDGLTIKSIEPDEYIANHIDEYSKACSFAIGKVANDTP